MTNKTFKSPFIPFKLPQSILDRMYGPHAEYYRNKYKHFCDGQYCHDKQEHDKYHLNRQQIEARSLYGIKHALV